MEFEKRILSEVFLTKKDKYGMCSLIYIYILAKEWMKANLQAIDLKEIGI